MKHPTISALEEKVFGIYSKTPKMPNIKKIHELLQELKIDHKFGHIRRKGRFGHTISIKHKVYGSLEMNSLERYYSWNTENYARTLLRIINYENQS